LAAALEELEGDVGAILATRILRQVQLDDVAATWIDGNVQHVGANPDEFFARGAGGRQGTGLLLTCDGRQVIVRAVVSSRCRRRIGQLRNSAGLCLAGLGRQGRLAIVLIPLKNQQVGNDCQGYEQDRAFDIHGYSVIDDELEVLLVGTGS